MLDMQGLSIERTSRRVWVDGVLKPRRLTVKEHKLLLHLASCDGEICSRAETVFILYGTVYQPDIDNGRLDALVERTRKKIEQNPRLPRFLKTVHRHGHQLLECTIEGEKVQSKARAT